VIWEMAEGRSGDYDSLMGKDVFEFYAIFRAYKKRIKKNG
jgi:hypothetical protein